MEIINKSHEEIKSNKREKLGVYLGIRNNKEINISAGATMEYGLAPGLFMHVVNDEDKWFIYFDNDCDGFLLNERKGKNAVFVFDASLIRLFCKRTHHQIPCKFQLKLTGAKQNGHHLIEILHHTPLEDYV